MAKTRQERLAAMRGMQAANPPSDTVKTKHAIQRLPKLVRQVRQQLKQFERVFKQLGAADKKTAFFNAIAAEADGMATLHDLGTLLDVLYTVANDYRAEGEPLLTQPFTDANVTYYESNGVSN